jgi:hypothetical protein
MTMATAVVVPVMAAVTGMVVVTDIVPSQALDLAAVVDHLPVVQAGTAEAVAHLRGVLLLDGHQAATASVRTVTLATAATAAPVVATADA